MGMGTVRWYGTLQKLNWSTGRWYGTVQGARYVVRKFWKYRTLLPSLYASSAQYVIQVNTLQFKIRDKNYYKKFTRIFFSKTF